MNAPAPDYLLTFSLLITACKNDWMLPDLFVSRTRCSVKTLRCAREKPARSRFDGDDALDLDRNLVRQHHVADRRAGMAACLAEHFNKQIGTAVDDFGRVVEIRRGVDHAEQLDDEIDPVERA